MRVAAVAALLLALAGCGSDANKGRRDAVDAYLARVNTVQAQSASALHAANAAYRGFWTTKPSPSRDARLARAVVALRTVRARVRAIEAPPDARRLRARLLRLLDLEAAFAAEVRQLGSFLGATTAPLASADAASRWLATTMRSAKTAKQQADVVDRYAGGVDTVVASLAAATPPRSLRRWHAANLANLRRTAATAHALASALRGTNRGLAELAGWRFRRAVAASASTPRLLRNALIAFNALASRVSVAATAVQGERDRLQRTLQ